MSATTAALEWLPTRPAMWQLTRRERAHRPGELNLKSCELLQPRIQRWLRERLRSLSESDVIAYPLSRPAHDAVAGHLGRRSEEVLLSPGTDHAIRVVSEALCAPAGRLVISDPHFDRWRHYAVQDGYHLDAVAMPERAPVAVGALIDRLRAGGPAVLAVTQPDSLTGHLLRGDELAELADAAGRHGSLLVLDTCYLAFAEAGEDTLSSVAGRRDVLRINSFSKSLGLAGARIGALCGDQALIDYLARWGIDGMISGISLRLLVLALGDLAVFQSAWAEVRTAREALGRGLPAVLPGWQARPSEANFVAFDATAEQATEVYDALLAAGIRTRLLSGLPGLPGGLRIATPSTAAVDQVLAAIAAVPGHPAPEHPGSEHPVPERPVPDKVGVVT